MNHVLKWSPEFTAVAAQGSPVDVRYRTSVQGGLPDRSQASRLLDELFAGNFYCKGKSVDGPPRRNEIWLFTTARHRSACLSRGRLIVGANCRPGLDCHPINRLQMDKETFYRKLIQALFRSGFVLRAGELSNENLSKDRDTLSSVSRMIAQFAPAGFADIHPFFDQEFVQKCLNEVRDWATVVTLKCVLGQPVILAVVDADKLTQEAMFGLAKRLDKAVVEVLDVTARLGGVKIGNFQLYKGTRLGATGIILRVFFDQMSASAFIEQTQKRCKILHLFKKTWVLPWAVDIPNKVVSSHRGLPFLPGVINRDDLQDEIFQ
jgi:hypothetical protein